MPNCILPRAAAAAAAALASSVPNRSGARWGPAGGLPRAVDLTGRFFVVSLGLPEGMRAVFDQDGESYVVKHASSG